MLNAFKRLGDHRGTTTTLALAAYCQVPTVLQGSGVDGWCLTVQGRQAFRHDTNHQIWSTSFWLDLAQLSFVCCFVLVQALVVVVELVVHSSHQRLQKIQGESMPRSHRPQKHTRGFQKSLRAWLASAFSKVFKALEYARKAKGQGSIRTKSHQHCFSLSKNPNACSLVLLPYEHC